MAVAALNKNGDGHDTPQLDPYIMKILVVGDAKCGKSTLIRKFAQGNFAGEIFADGGSTVYRFNYQHPRGERQYAFVEIASALVDDLDRALHNHMYAKGCIFMYGIDDPPSFTQLKDKWIPGLENFINDAEISAIAVGFKADLRQNQYVVNLLGLANLAPVTYEEGHSLAEHELIERYFECSHNDLEGINDVFTYILNNAFAAANH